MHQEHAFTRWRVATPGPQPLIAAFRAGWEVRNRATERLFRAAWEVRNRATERLKTPPLRDGITARESKMSALAKMEKAERLAEELHFIHHASFQLADWRDAEAFIAQHFTILRPIFLESLQFKAGGLKVELAALNVATDR